jgi:tripartite-type tricarboxylate transporter receptor subunit TctC
MSFASNKTGGLQRRQVLGAVAAAGLFGSAPLVAAQTAWKPSGTIKVVVPWPPGGATDILARFMGPGMSERLGATVIVDNKAGATGSVGSQFVYNAPPDGLTMLFGILDAQSIYPHLAQPRYDPMKFVPLAPTGTAPFLLLARPDLPAKSVKDLIALAKTKSLSYGSAGVGGSPHMMAVALGNTIGVKNMLHVPFQGMAPALQALMAGQIDILLVVAGGALQYRGKLKIYGVSSSERLAVAPDIPTLTEQGVPLVGSAWTGMLAPPNLPANIGAELSKAIQEVTATPAYQAKLVELGMLPMKQSQQEFAKYYRDEYQRWGELVRVNNIKLD